MPGQARTGLVSGSCGGTVPSGELLLPGRLSKQAVTDRLPGKQARTGRREMNGQQPEELDLALVLLGALYFGGLLSLIACLAV